jgi:hypothetical protein
MTTQRHIVKRQVLELHISSMADAQQLQTEVSRIYRQRIVPLIDQYCTALSDPDRIHRIESLELNLGTVHPQYLEENLVAQVSTQLRTLLAERITADERKAEGSGANRKTTSQLELFSVFAQTGSVPWWADSSQPHLLDDCLQYLLHNAPGPFRGLLRELAQEQSSLQRIVRHFADRLLADLAAVLAPSLDVSAFAHMVRDLVLVLQSTTNGAGQRQTRLRHLVWGVIMQQVSLRGEQATAWPPLFQAVLIRVAGELGVAYTALLSSMYQVVRENQERFQSPIDEITETLYQEALLTQATSPAVRNDSALTGLWRLLHSLAMQLPEPSQAPLLAALERLERGPMDNEAVTALLQVLRLALVQQHLPPPFIPRWRTELEQLAVDGFSPERIQALTEILQASLQEAPSPLTGDTSRAGLLSSRLGVLSPPAGERQREGAIQRGISQSSHKTLWGEDHPETGPRRQGEESIGAPKTIKTPLNLTFSDADELYIDNAGLVILHPFLRHFFERLELLEDKQFKDMAARQRAVGLLQYAVSEDPSSPEYLLPLNKVLCGMELDEVFDFGPPVTETEAEECTNLLTAAIANAPILKNMTINGLRGTFLLRPGVLSSRDGAWLLRVERETYDVVLDRFPWTMQWVKLPWMDTPLRIEW